MECPVCNRPLQIARSYPSFKHDNTPSTPTELYRNMDMVCINPTCTMYAGDDLKNATKIAQTISHREV